MKTTRLVPVEVDTPHPWKPGVERFRPAHLWVFYGTKLERATRQQWRLRPGWRRCDTPAPERRPRRHAGDRLPSHGG